MNKRGQDALSIALIALLIVLIIFVIILIITYIPVSFLQQKTTSSTTTYIIKEQQNNCRTVKVPYVETYYNYEKAEYKAWKAIESKEYKNSYLVYVKNNHPQGQHFTVKFYIPNTYDRTTTRTIKNYIEPYETKIFRQEISLGHRASSDEWSYQVIPDNTYYDNYGNYYDEYYDDYYNYPERRTVLKYKTEVVCD